jgi:hypothetical protein
MIEVKNTSGATLWTSQQETVGNAVGEAVHKGVELTMADLKGADLRKVNLEGAKLLCADLRGANLLGANLKMASLVNADLTGAQVDVGILSANIVGAKGLPGYEGNTGVSSKPPVWRNPDGTVRSTPLGSRNPKHK